MVWKAADRKSRQVVALKKIFDAFQNATDAQVGDTLNGNSSACRPEHCVTRDAYSCARQYSDKPPIRQPNSSLRCCWNLQRTFREIMFLQELTNVENIIK